MSYVRIILCSSYNFSSLSPDTFATFPEPFTNFMEDFGSILINSVTLYRSELLKDNYLGIISGPFFSTRPESPLLSLCGLKRASSLLFSQSLEESIEQNMA